jgi:hypothetical protein
MKKIPFELFGAGQEIYFDIGRFAAIESMAKKSIGEVIGDEALNISNTAILLSAGLRHYGQKNPQWYLEKMQELLDAGHEMEEIQTPLMKAIAGSGILGRAIYLTVFPEEKTAADEKKLAAERKN